MGASNPVGTGTPPGLRVVAFDIIGTVFSMAPMRTALTELGLPALALDFLYTAALRDTFALGATGAFAPFQSVMAGCLDELLAMEGVTASEARKQAVLGLMKTLPPYGDARAAFEVLAGAGLRIVALSNGAAATTQGLLTAAGLADLVERVLSVEAVGLAKPRPEVYRYAAREAGVAPETMALVATHPWDIHGAKAVGLVGGYVARGRPFSPALRAPDVTGETLLDVARTLAAPP